MDIPFVDLHKQYASVRTDIDAAISRVVESAVFIGGQEVDAFEREFADFCESKYAIGVSSGTAALELIFRALDLGPGDEVIVQANSYVSTAYAVSATGAVPIFVENDPRTFNIDVTNIDSKISARTRAICITHLFGQSANMDQVMSIARKHSLPVIEDACQSHGARFGGTRVGTFGTAAAFSFYPGKNLGAYGDGGAVTTQDEHFAEKIRLLREYGQTRKYVHESKGTNARLDALQAAILRAKLKHLEKWNSERRRIAGMYTEHLADLPLLPPAVHPKAEHVFHIYAILTERRDELRAYLEERDIHCNIHYPIPIHLQNAYKELGHKRGDFPAAESAAEHMLSLPLFPELSAEQLDFVASTISAFFR